jgi:hypothetical protein
MADEEEKLNRFMNRKSEEAFEKKRREALEKYAQKTGKTDFQLAEKEKPVKSTPPALHETTHSATSIPQHSNPNWKEEHERRAREEREREIEEQKRRDAALKELSKDSVDDLAKWKEEQERKEKEFRQKLAEEDRRKNEEIERMKREVLLKRQQEEEEHRKQQAAKQPPPQAAPQSTNWCENCKREFSGILDVYVVNGKKYCNACRTVAHTSDPKQPKCAHCNLPLELTWLKAAGRKYHPECLKCSQCGGDLSKGFRQTGKTFTCTNCSGFGLKA